MSLLSGSWFCHSCDGVKLQIFDFGNFSCLQEHVDPKLITNDDVLGDPIPYDQQDSMRQMCYQLFDLTPSVCSLQNFVFVIY